MIPARSDGHQRPATHAEYPDRRYQLEMVGLQQTPWAALQHGIVPRATSASLGPGGSLSRFGALQLHSGTTVAFGGLGCQS